MREDLAREFPEAVRGATWLRARVAGRRLSLWSEPIVWASISAIGSGLLAAAVAQAVVGLLNEGLQALGAPLPFPIFPLVTITGTAAAVAVAVGAGGVTALALNLAYVVIGIAIRLPGLRTFCERAGGAFPAPGPDQCTAIGFVASLWPQVIGLGVGIALARAVTPRGDGINSALRVAGAFAIAQFVVSSLWAFAVAQTFDATTSTLTLAAAVVGAAIAAGVVAAQLPGAVRSASIVAGIWLVPWAALQLPFATRSLSGPIAADKVVPIAATILIDPVAAAFLVLSAAIAARGRFIPRQAP